MIMTNMAFSGVDTAGPKTACKRKESSLIGSNLDFLYDFITGITNNDGKKSKWQIPSGQIVPK